ncbi:nitrilase-related carbon-nitrogen hydrolase [Psychrobacillus lasiicapitis]|uniref:CN hydrolase domain-containing protein n=1 Tax=Psychrobacillus lasiicapitis TaxID=1636719 RepID=A0A544T1Y4_9BACI|nr:nitrilase-related carbon-nitrogen hydrolase [Psychrobacillus lasiicapitis]TQR11420.1 hypothetical protein FG382_15860 [Psychrobacillus lasiicapitis]GGA40697.1 hypothetical protein GCM10011384_32940 [Psychrobacillus lasiicapitis]
MQILLVQPYEDYQYNYQNLYDEVLDIIKHQKVDLVVFPEAFIQLENEEDPWSFIENIADFLNKPVLLGFSMPDGSERAYYLNWEPKEGETEEKFYIKHSTARKTLFDFELTNEEQQMMYTPVILNGKRIQPYICHDMFFPLVTERLEKQGADILINLTGGNVKMSKWCNILKGRSIELNSYVFCTMGNRINMNQPSDRIGYYQGQKLRACYTKGNGEEEHAYSIFSIADKQVYLDEMSPYYSDKMYDQFTVGTNRLSDCIIDITSCTIKSTLQNRSDDEEYSLILIKGKENIQVHIVNYEDLYDRTYLYKVKQSRDAHQIFVYITSDKVDLATTIALLKLRVIENRIAAVVATPDLLIGAKTNRYKDVQLFEGKDNQIGFDLQHMYGTSSIYQKNGNSMMGIVEKHKKKYEGLLSNEINI